ncbi:tumor protein D53 isoform X6 [Anarrhichthys ocellatus]|uniref:tumor protein D53 isoform X6 n=1 Tax=Anarrhichthys ocellatus TaxID=433405 RepID=UPI0012ED0522|nr:tumor protein D53 isoform X6 [Anarrhichthys ocellatus]
MLCPVRALFSIKEYVQLLVNYANCESARPIGSCSKLRLNKKTGPARDTQNNPRKHTPTRSRYRPGAARVLPCVSSRLKRLFGKFSPALALMETRQQGFLDSEPLRETDEDMASEVHLNSLTEEEREEIQQELAKLEEEISTLKQVLTSKEKQHAELKQKLGMSSLNELRNNLSRGWHDVQTTTAYKKTSETLSTAGQKTSAAFNTLGSAITRKFGDMRSNSIGYAIRHSMSMPTMRNSPSFKSFEEKVETTVSTIKTKVGGTETGGSFEEVLSSAAHASSQDTPTNNLTDSSSERPC